MSRTKYANARPVPPGPTRWPVRLAIAGLLLLAVIPTLGGVIRLADLAGDPVVTEANARFVAAPTPVIAHILASIAFTAIGAFQFVPQTRRAIAKRHRAIGRALLPLGMVSALTGLWMTLTYPWPAGDGLALYLIRLLFGGAMTLSLVLSVAALARRDYPKHAAWMTRTYAIGAGAGTQALLLLPATIALGTLPEALRTSLMGATWVVNLVIAELVNHRRSTGRGAERGSGSSHSARPGRESLPALDRRRMT